MPALLARLLALPAATRPVTSGRSLAASRVAADVPNDLSFLVGVRTRVPLTGNGPRALAIAGSQLFVAHYFSDSLDRIDLASRPWKAATIALGPPPGDHGGPARGDALQRRVDLVSGLAKLRELPLGRCAGGRPELGPAQRRHRQPQEHQEPALVAPDPARHEHGRARDRRDRGPRRPEPHPVHRPARGGRRLPGRAISSRWSQCRARGSRAGGSPPRPAAGRSVFRSAEVGCAACHPPARCSPT